MSTAEKIAKFCIAVKNGFGTITDSQVKDEYIRMNETISSGELANLLSILEKHNLLDKKNSVNKAEDFYQRMFNLMTKK